MEDDGGGDARYLTQFEIAETVGAVVAIDVLRAFTTAAYALGAGARHIVLVDTIEEALAFKAANPGALAMGENFGRRVDGFDFSNSPVEIAAADVAGRVIVQRTSAGTRGVVAARSATRLWCASLVCASATAAAVRASGLGAPTYVITGRWPAADGDGYAGGEDDQLTAELIERARRHLPLAAETTARLVATCDEAAHTLSLGAGSVDPEDITLATRVDAFDFAMEVRRAEGMLVLEKHPSP